MITYVFAIALVEVKIILESDLNIFFFTELDKVQSIQFL